MRGYSGRDLFAEINERLFARGNVSHDIEYYILEHILLIYVPAVLDKLQFQTCGTFEFFSHSIILFIARVFAHHQQFSRSRPAKSRDVKTSDKSIISPGR